MDAVITFQATTSQGRNLLNFSSDLEDLQQPEGFVESTNGIDEGHGFANVRDTNAGIGVAVIGCFRLRL